MNKINNSGKWIIAGVVVVAIIVIVIVHGAYSGQSDTSMATNSTSSSAGSTTTPPAPSSPVTATPATSSASAKPVSNPAPQTPPPPPQTVIHLITPVTDDHWVIGQQDPISWDTDPTITGEIDLLNASDKSFVGVILSETGAHQTSYSWDTRAYFLSRYSPLKKDLLPGTYLVEVKFDGNNLPDLIGGPITITN